MLADDDDDNVATAGPSKGSGSQQPAWMRALYERCKDWLGQLPSVRSLLGLYFSNSNVMVSGLPYTAEAIRGQSGPALSPLCA